MQKVFLQENYLHYKIDPMEKYTFKKLFFFIGISFFCLNVFAQGPTDPGNDPLIFSNGSGPNTRIQEQKTQEKNVQKQAFSLKNVPFSYTYEVLKQKNNFSDFSEKRNNQKFKTTTIFSRSDDNERRLKLILPLVLFAFQQI
jgi:hypothetical protein